MAYSEQIYNYVRNFFDQHNFKYTEDTDRGCFNYGINTDSQLSVRYRIAIRQRGLTCYATAEMHADEEHRPAVAEYVSRANDGLRIGCFETDFRDGEIRYKVSVHCGEHLPDEAAMVGLLLTPSNMIKRYGNDLIKVMFGFSTPEDACKHAESQS